MLHLVSKGLSPAGFRLERYSIRKIFGSNPAKPQIGVQLAMVGKGKSLPRQL
jgi:hypothetical protein